MKMIPKSQLPKTVDEYMERLPEDVRIVLSKLRATIKSTAPEAEELISYGMPGYKYYGMLVYFSAFKNHCSFFPGSAQIVKESEELKSFKTSKGTIQFSVAKPLPVALIKKIVKARMKANEIKHFEKQEKQSIKKSKKK